MKIINKTKNTVLAEDAVAADTVFSRLKGLLGRKAFIKGEALIITPCNSIHTFFMRFPIDVLFVDKNNKIVKVLAQLSPFRFSKLYWKSKTVVELPSGKINSTQTQYGDSLQLLD
jgi:uncharacterized membrane protein (UPF0127 family)